MRLAIFVSTAMLMLAAAMPAHGQQQGSGLGEPGVGQPVASVVELFTSQGCSSCPPADAQLRILGTRSDVLTLAYHIDYWNYLGWEDTLSSPANTARQKAYARALERSSVYTPQAVLNGHDHINGSKGAIIERRLAWFTREGRGLTVDVGLRHHDDTITITVGSAPEKTGNLIFVVFDRSNSVEITRGENAGRTMVYRNAVRSYQTVGLWKGKPLQVDLPATLLSDWDRQGCAVILQATANEAGDPGAILGAAVLR